MKRCLAASLAVLIASLVALVPTTADADTPTGKLLMVLDSSGSMKEPAGDGHTKAANAKTALNEVVDSLDPQSQVGMRVYGATVFDKSQPGACTDSQLVVPIGPAGDKKALRSAIDSYKPYGETPIAYALQQAGHDLGSSGQRTIVLVSDGEETCNENPCQIAADLAAKGIDLRIDVIGLDVSGKARDQLRCIAAEGKGKYSQADNLTQLKKQLTVAKERALHPFEVTGTPVKGSYDQLSAPTIGNGRWTDRLPSRGKTTFYKLHRTMTSSTFWVGVSAELNVAGALTNGVDLNLTTEGGQACGSGYPYAIGGSDATTGLMFGLTVSRGPYAQAACLTGDLILTISQRGNNKTDLGGTATQLSVYEEPPATDAADLPPKSDRPVWTPMTMGSSSKIKGAAAFADAPLLASGKTYTFDIAPGETQIFAVKAGWGQRIQALANAGTVVGGSGPFNDASFNLVGPYGGDADSAWATNMPTGGNLAPYTGAAAARTTPTIRYHNTDDSSTTVAALAGTYYVVLSYPKRKHTALPTIPVLLKTSVIGTAGSGTPVYDKDGIEPTVSPSPNPTATPTPTVTASAIPSATSTSQARKTSDPTPWVLVGGLLGGAVVLAGAGIVAVSKLRRS